MKSLLLQLIAIFTFSTLVSSCAKKDISNISSSETDPKIIKTCMKAADFKGFVEIMSGEKVQEKTNEDPLNDLKKNMKKIAARINNGMTMKDSTLFFQPLVDSLSLVENEYSKEEAVITSKKASELFVVIRQIFNARVQTIQQGINYPTCSYKPTEVGIEMFNKIYGSQAIIYEKTGMWGRTTCSNLEIYENQMFGAISSLLMTGSK